MKRKKSLPGNPEASLVSWLMRVDTRYWQNLLVLLLGICILKTGAAVNYNREVYRGYTQRYEPLNLDWSGQEMVDYIDRNRFSFDVPGYNQTAYTVTLTRPLRYYTEPSAFSKVAVELGAGQRVVLFGRYDSGCGSNTFPTSRRGWRCAVPLLPMESEKVVVLHSDMSYSDVYRRWGRRYYYVRLEDLMSIGREFYLQAIPDNSDYVRRLYDYLGHSSPEYFLARTFDPFAYGITDYLSDTDKFLEELTLRERFTSFDKEFYRRGCCISPDLLQPLWDRWNTVMLMGAAGCLVLLFYRNKKKKLG